MKLSYVVINPSLVAQSSILAHPHHIRWAWLALICEGQFRDGVIPGLTPFQLSRMAACSIEEAQEALEVFLSPDPWSACQEEEGRRLIPTGNPNEYRMVSWESQQSLIAKARDAARKRADRYSGQDRTNPDSVPAVPAFPPPSPSPSPSPSGEETLLSRPPVSTKPFRLFTGEEVEMQLAVLLRARIRERLPQFKEPNMQAWARDIDLMRRLDNRSVDDIRRVIDWCQADEFWKNNILSTSKLRKQFDQLLLKSGPPRKSGHGIATLPMPEFE